MLVPVLLAAPGCLLRWTVKTGDHVLAGEPVAVIEDHDGHARDVVSLVSGKVFALHGRQGRKYKAADALAEVQVSAEEAATISVLPQSDFFEDLMQWAGFAANEVRLTPLAVVPIYLPPFMSALLRSTSPFLYERYRFYVTQNFLSRAALRLLFEKSHEELLDVLKEQMLIEASGSYGAGYVRGKPRSQE